jgi:hypothetical protein
MRIVTLFDATEIFMLAASVLFVVALALVF